MNDVFGSSYADAYDLLYFDKDYTAECDLIERTFQTYANAPIRSVLDLGCGTGNHAIPLAQRGYKVVGVDCSESMIDHANKKLAGLSGKSDVFFHQGDIQSIDLQNQFNAALMMFAVLGYQLENADVLAALRTARRHLSPGGIFIFDVWYGPAVLYQRPSQRIKVVPTPKGKILRVSSGELDIRRHVCTVHYHIWRLDGNLLAAEAEESHSMRYFFPRELDLFLDCSGFAPVRLGGFPESDQEPDETTWNVMGVALAI